MKTRPLTIVLLLVLPVFPLLAEEGSRPREDSRLDFHLVPGTSLPLDSRGLFQPGLAASIALDWSFLPFLGISGQAGFSSIPTNAEDAVTLIEGSLGPLLRWRLLDRLSLGLRGQVGLYQFQWREYSDFRLRLGGNLSASFHISPLISLTAFAGYTSYLYQPDPFLDSINLGLGVSFNLFEITRKRTRIQGEQIMRNMVFPVSYAWYENNPVINMRITNLEPNSISNARVSFFLERYMSQPTIAADIPRLAPGESADITVTALFNETMLDLTENISANARILINYQSLGSLKEAAIPVQLPIYHRNAMTWDDDRRAASFVSPRDPIALLFSRHVGSLVESRMQGDYNRNIQYALGLFEALNLYGIYYIIDPASSYAELSDDAGQLDSLNYPFETLFYHGGDCDDLSILFCSLMEVQGIDTAFITIPGHIYMAFDSGLSEDEGRLSSFAPDLISYEGRAWVPLEITIPGSGFSQAWRVGSREWQNAAGEREIFPLKEAWSLYPPVNVPGAGSHNILLPDAAAINAAFEASLAKVKSLPKN
ncbi:putative tetratricopeptide TPR_2 repeat protein [Treponema primitia ZAS-2]|uniref:Putative tetratricopeptide TPR_2 repeat protein n=1 Tax=Treponema primitia (strain ATCC BAA-887 / DSM 12427 / ZAS-2) TaxID=545694 RepID=F5YNE6_TREPZ|nr:hypothetical protein [Treponema primitia]AEF86765.1 putative tetratricopeptide TPR_2 repeat protein [Treponema primitia ZAS-2]